MTARAWDGLLLRVTTGVTTAQAMAVVTQGCQGLSDGRLVECLGGDSCTPGEPDPFRFDAVVGGHRDGSHGVVVAAGPQDRAPGAASSPKAGRQAGEDGCAQQEGPCQVAWVEVFHVARFLPN